MPTKESTEYEFEIGRLLFRQGDFLKAEAHLVRASRGFYSEKKYDRFTETLNLLLRIYAEREDFGKIQEEKERLQDLVVKENLQLSAMNYYTLGLCSAYRSGQEPVGIDYFQKALQIAMQNDAKSEMCFAIYGLAVCYYNMDDYESALRELSHLQVFFGVVSIPDIEISERLLMANIHRNRGSCEKAIELYWQSFELLKTHKNGFLSQYVMYGLGSTFLKAGDKGLARLYLDLALRATDERQFPRLVNRIKSQIAEMGGTETNKDFDLVFEFKTNSVVERLRGRVDFKNQFILLDLLHLFVKNPGKVFAKEQLVRKVWNQEYDPSIHDNKIYVTIKRLRKMIEPDFDKPKYIFRAKNGYFLNKSVRVHVHH